MDRDQFWRGGAWHRTEGLRGLVERDSLKKMLIRSGGAVSRKKLFQSLCDLVSLDGDPLFTISVKNDSALRAFLKDREVGIVPECRGGCSIVIEMVVVQQNDLIEMRKMTFEGDDPMEVFPEWFNELHMRIGIVPINESKEVMNHWVGTVVFDPNGLLHEACLSFIDFSSSGQELRSFPLDEDTMLEILTVLVRQADPRILPSGGDWKAR